MGQQSIRRRGPRRFKNGSIKVLAKVREPTDIALYAGNFEELLRLANERARKSFLQWDDTLTEERASAGIVIRSLLHVAHELEGWGVSLSRWILQAASSSRAPKESLPATAPTGIWVRTVFLPTTTCALPAVKA
jgi:hypothetical protein